MANVNTLKTNRDDDSEMIMEEVMYGVMLEREARHVGIVSVFKMREAR